MYPKNTLETETYQRNLIRTVLFNLNKKRTNPIVVHHTFSKVFDIATSLFMRDINFYFQQQYCAFKLTKAIDFFITQCRKSPDLIIFSCRLVMVLYRPSKLMIFYRAIKSEKIFLN